MPATVRCPACQRTLSVPSKKLGQLVTCPACQAGFTADPPTDDSNAAGRHVDASSAAFHCPTCQKPMDILGCTPGQTFLCFHCSQPFAIPGKVEASAESGVVPGPPLRIQSRDVTTKPTKFTDGLGEFLAMMAALALAILVVCGVLSALGIKANGNRVKWVTYSVAFLIFVAASSAISGLKKLAAVIRAPADSSPGPTPVPLQPQGAMPSVLAVSPQANTTNPAPRITPRGHDQNNEQWWLAHDGQVIGPYPTASILTGARAGRFTPDTQICRVGGNYWVPIPVWLKEPAANSPV